MMGENQTTVDNNSITIELLYKNSFKILLDNIVVCIANTIIAVIVCILLCVTVIGILAIPAVFGGYTESMIRMSLGQKVEIGKFFSSGFNRWGTLLFANVIYCIGVLIGLVCFIIPGIYLMIRWFFITQIIVNEGLTVSEAFTKSGNMISNKFWEVTAVFIICAIIDTIGGMFGILILATIPYISIVSSKYYISNLNKLK